MSTNATVYTVTIPGRVPDMTQTGTADEIVTWLRKDWNDGADQTGAPKIDTNAEYMQRITSLCVNRSGVTPKFPPSKTHSYDPLQFLLYMQATDAIKFIGENAVESKQLYAEEIEGRHDFHRQVNDLTGKAIIAALRGLSHLEHTT